MFAVEDDAGGGPPERGDVGAKGSSKIVSVCARRVLICGTEESTSHCQHYLLDMEGYEDHKRNDGSTQFFVLLDVY